MNQKGAKSSTSSSSSSRLLTDFQIVQILGSGSFGIVCKVKNNLDKKSYAIKIVSSSHGSHDLREVQNLASVPPHNNVVMYFTCWQDNLKKDDFEKIKQIFGKSTMEVERILSLNQYQVSLNILCIQMELCSQDLRQWLGKQSSVNEHKSINIFLQICSGLEHIHKHNFIHRDLKPENIFFSSIDPNTIKIGDLGIATNHSAQASVAIHTRGAGTPLYLAPEQGSIKYGAAADLYALGLILYELFDPSLQAGIGSGSYEQLIQGFKVLKFNSVLPGTISIKWPKVAKLVLSLVSLEPKQRPKFDVIKEIFKDKAAVAVDNNLMVKKNVQVPVNPKQMPKFDFLKVNANNLNVKNVQVPVKPVVVQGLTGLNLKDSKICAKCKRQIFGKVINALNQTWHEEHFCCSYCLKPIQESDYYQHSDGKIYCSTDYLKLIGPTCFGCKKSILSSQYMSVNNKETGRQKWHLECFICTACRKPISNSKSFTHEGKIYCDVDFFKLFAPKCNGCHKPIDKKHVTVESKTFGSMKWHTECFICSECGSSIGDTHGIVNNKPICSKCYRKLRG